jgi:hypothetical protein
MHFFSNISLEPLLYLEFYDLHVDFFLPLFSKFLEYACTSMNDYDFKGKTGTNSDNPFGFLYREPKIFKKLGKNVNLCCFWPFSIPSDLPDIHPDDLWWRIRFWYDKDNQRLIFDLADVYMIYRQKIAYDQNLNFLTLCGLKRNDFLNYSIYLSVMYLLSEANLLHKSQFFDDRSKSKHFIVILCAKKLREKWNEME